MKRILLLSLVSAVAITAHASTPPPTAVITHFPHRHEVVFFSGEEVLFDGSGSYANFAGGSITRWDWYVDGSWKHGGTGSQHKTFSWTFTLGQGETEKTFQLRLRVRDSQNQYGNKYLTVTVKLKPKRYYYLKDHLGSVRAVVDENGNVVSYDDYYPFGLTMPGRSLAGDAYAREKYTGHEKDEETNWFYAGARYYNPELGRWMNPDPLMDKYPGWSPYNYVLNDPLRLVDPDGRDARVTVNSQDSTVTVSASIVFYGDVTEEDATEILSYILAHWDNEHTYLDESSGIEYRLVLDLSVEVRDSAPSLFETVRTGLSRSNLTNLVRIDDNIDRSYVRAGYTGRWESGQKPAVYAHEFGHFIGFKDRYDDVKKNGRTISVAHAGWENNLMGSLWGQVGGANLQAFMQRYVERHDRLISRSRDEQGRTTHTARFRRMRF